MKIKKNWIPCVQDRGKWKEVVEKAKTFNQEVQRLEEEEEEEEGNYFENIQHFSFAYIFIWVRKLDSDSLTETKN